MSRTRKGAAQDGGATPGAGGSAWDAEGDPPGSYAAAESELESILAALEDEAVDVDQLTAHVTRAKALITWCRARVAAAELTITELLDEG